MSERDVHAERCARFARKAAELRASMLKADGIGGAKRASLSRDRMSAIMGGYTTAWWLVELGWPLVQPEVAAALQAMTGVGLPTQKEPDA